MLQGKLRAVMLRQLLTKANAIVKKKKRWLVYVYVVHSGLQPSDNFQPSPSVLKLLSHTTVPHFSVAFIPAAAATIFLFFFISFFFVVEKHLKRYNRLVESVQNIKLQTC